MKSTHKLILLFLLIMTISFTDCVQLRHTVNEPINTIVGDQSFIEAFGRAPDGNVNDRLRIRTHLLYAEKLLRQRNVSSFTNEMRRKREFLLDKLHEYALAGKFPYNHDHPEARKPCFIDRDGNICAVGYLIQESAGRDIAERINLSHKYDFVAEMNDPMVDEWIAHSGLTKEECEIIQPSYGWDYGNNTEISSGVSYRFNGRINYHGAVALLSYYKSNNVYTGLGLSFDYFQKSNFEIGLDLFGELDRYSGHILATQIALSPECFQYDHTVGMNLKPGLNFILLPNSPLNLHVGYGYEFSIVAGKKFGAGRHDLVATLAYELRDVPKSKNSGGW